MTASHICADCKYFKTSFTVPRGSEQKQLVVKCEEAHAPIWLFSGEQCPDYKSKQSELQEDRYANQR